MEAENNNKKLNEKIKENKVIIKKLNVENHIL